MVSEWTEFQETEGVKGSLGGWPSEPKPNRKIMVGDVEIPDLYDPDTFDLLVLAGDLMLDEREPGFMWRGRLVTQLEDMAMIYAMKWGSESIARVFEERLNKWLEGGDV